MSDKETWHISPALYRTMLAIARELRHEITESERILWQALRGKQLSGRRFRRQEAIGPFVVDFYCAAERLVVEVDGKIHLHQVELDRERQSLLESLGLRFVRVTVEQVMEDLPGVLSQIEDAFCADD